MTVECAKIDRIDCSARRAADPQKPVVGGDRGADRRREKLRHSLFLTLVPGCNQLIALEVPPPGPRVRALRKQGVEQFGTNSPHTCSSLMLILTVEDELFISEYLRGILEDDGHRVLATFDADEAIEVLERVRDIESRHYRHRHAGFNGRAPTGGRNQGPMAANPLNGRYRIDPAEFWRIAVRQSVYREAIPLRRNPFRGATVSVDPEAAGLPFGGLDLHANLSRASKMRYTEPPLGNEWQQNDHRH